jgi:hypothetical protein
VSAPCFNCGAPASHQHHVVPRSLGGVATVPLCHDCHGKAHGKASGFRDTKELTKAALAVLRARGEVSNHAPFGYRADGVRLVADEAEQAVIAQALALLKAGLTVRAVALKLEQAGIVSRRGKPLHFTAVADIARRAVAP